MNIKNCTIVISSHRIINLNIFQCTIWVNIKISYISFCQEREQVLSWWSVYSKIIRLIITRRPETNQLVASNSWLNRVSWICTQIFNWTSLIIQTIFSHWWSIIKININLISFHFSFILVRHWEFNCIQNLTGLNWTYNTQIC